jgi:hypothetical protein
MRITIRRFLLLVVAGLAISAALPGRCTQVMAQEQPQMSEEKTALYKKYYENRKGGDAEQKIAYEVGQEFIKQYGADNDQYVQAVRKFISKYEANMREFNFKQALIAKDYPKTFEIGRQILAVEPENFSVLVQLVQAGYLSFKGGNANLNADSIKYAKEGIQLLDTNKVTNPDPMSNLDDARGYLNFAQGWFLRESSPLEAAPFFQKAITSSKGYKVDATTYYLLGTAIFNGEYQQLYNEYKEKYAGKPESQEQKDFLERINTVSGRVIDAMARAVALASKPEQQVFKKQVLTQLTDIYKDFHNNNDDGLSDLIASVLTKPLP